jgi:hypothetical protein
MALGGVLMSLDKSLGAPARADSERDGVVAQRLVGADLSGQVSSQVP